MLTKKLVGNKLGITASQHHSITASQHHSITE